MRELAVTSVDLARLQFATTSLYHFLFVPLTLGLAPLVAVMQTLWFRSGDEAWLRLARFFGTLMLINFAIGVATGLVQEFQFGMNWSIYSEFVGDVFGAPLAIEGLAAFMLESTFLGLWIFGWDRLSKRLHLATIWIFALGAWLSAYFIIVANSWMQRPVGSTIRDGRAELTDVGALLANRFAIAAYTHVILVGLTTAAVVVFGDRVLAPPARTKRGALPPRSQARAHRGCARLRAEPRDREPPRRRRHRLPADEDRCDRGALGDRAARGLLRLPGRRLLRRRPGACASTSRSRIYSRSSPRAR